MSYLRNRIGIPYSRGRIVIPGTERKPTFMERVSGTLRRTYASVRPDDRPWVETMTQRNMNRLGNALYRVAPEPEPDDSDPRMAIPKLLRLFLTNPNLMSIGPYWDVIRKVLTSELDPDTYEPLVEILKIAQQHGNLIVEDNGEIYEGRLLSECPPDLKQYIIDIFRIHIQDV